MADKKITKESVIGDVVKDEPGSDQGDPKVFRPGCLTCPGMNMESISFGALNT